MLFFAVGAKVVALMEVPNIIGPFPSLESIGTAAAVEGKGYVLVDVALHTDVTVLLALNSDR